MIKSMTGYGRCEKIDENKKIVIDIKSVNHRYSDISVKVPRAYGYTEDKIRDYVASKVSRGKIDVFVYIEFYTTGDKLVVLDKALCRNYYNVLQEIKEECGFEDRLKLSDVSSFRDIFVTKQEDEDKDQVWQMILECLEPAMNDFLAAREREGSRMAKDVLEHAEIILKDVAKIEEIMPLAEKEYAEKLRQRMTELLGDFNIDESRLLTEVAIMADRICVSEELVRLKSHFVELDNILALDEPIGRKLDFLIQEINRETNTIGSKANDFGVAKTVVNIKAEIEKLREQIQNIE
ncbi:MAG: YicC family protein [Clostridia bacterium]|nr:YicC family protein [Clostridia bacterium]